MDPYDSYGSRKKKGSFIRVLAALVLVFLIIEYIFHYNVFDLLNNPKINPFFDSLYDRMIALWSHIEPYAASAWNAIVNGWMVLYEHLEPLIKSLEQHFGKLFHTIS